MMFSLTVYFIWYLRKAHFTHLPTSLLIACIHVDNRKHEICLCASETDMLVPVALLGSETKKYLLMALSI